jgi:hypothetical protein
MILIHKSRIKIIFYDLFSQYKKTDEINQSVFSETLKTAYYNWISYYTSFLS